MTGPAVNGVLEGKREALKLRARMVQAVRAFFISRGFLEVETPVLIPAPAPETHIDAPKAGDLYLQTSPELQMKRFLAAGYGNIFQLCRCFREGERGAKHLPEFTMLEWYRPGADYTALMEDCKDLFSHLSSALGVATLCHRGRKVGLENPWEEFTVDGAYRRFAGISAAEAVESGDFDLLMVEKVEPNLGLTGPAILKDYPAALAALARLKPSDPTVSERFEVYIAGLELANGFSELADPEEQRARFAAEAARRLAFGREVYPTPEKFLAELGSMVEAAGIALGLDRLAMLFAGAASIDQVTAFTPEEL